MAESSRPIVVALLAVPDVTAATLYGFHDTLCGVGRDWQMVHGGTALSPFRPLVVSADGEPFTAANGVRIAPEAGFADCPRPDIVCITDLAVAPGAKLDGVYDAAADWIRERHADGALLASACSGAALLARTGLLEGLDATSHWAYCDALR